MKHFFDGTDFAYVAEITTTLFFLFFVVVLLWSLRPSAARTYKEASMLPFEEDSPKNQGMNSQNFNGEVLR